VSEWYQVSRCWYTGHIRYIIVAISFVCVCACMCVCVFLSFDLYILIQGAMSSKEVKDTEATVLTLIDGDNAVYAKESSLSVAKEVKGIRAIFDEVMDFIWNLCIYLVSTLYIFTICPPI